MEGIQRFLSDAAYQAVSAADAPSASNPFLTASAASAKVDGPASSVNNTVPVFDGVTGKLLKGSNITAVNENVGIANNNPTEKLDVIGNIRSSAEVHAGTKVVIASKVEQVYDSVNQSLKFNFL